MNKLKSYLTLKNLIIIGLLFVLLYYIIRDVSVREKSLYATVSNIENFIQPLTNGCVPVPKDNPITEAKISLGRKLF